MVPVASVKDNDIEAAAAMDDVDRAAKHLQDRASIATGDVASHYLNEEKWAGANRTARINCFKNGSRRKFYTKSSRPTSGHRFLAALYSITSSAQRCRVQR